MNRVDEVIERVRLAKFDGNMVTLVDDLANVPGDVLFDALFPVAVRERKPQNGPVYMSAVALHALNPPCPLSIDAAVKMLLLSWSFSIAEVPWYLAKQFGAREALASVERLRLNHDDALSLTWLKCIDKWVKLAVQIESLVVDLETVPGDVLFAALFSVAVRAQGPQIGPVYLSAIALHALHPRCSLPIDTAVEMLLPSWEISLEEVPWYLVKQFGVAEVLASVERVRKNRHDELSTIQLNTIDYWVKIAAERC